MLDCFSWKLVVVGVQILLGIWASNNCLLLICDYIWLLKLFLKSRTLEVLAKVLMQTKQEFPVTLNEPSLGLVNFCWEFLTIAFSVVPRADNKGLVFYLCAVTSHWMHEKFSCHIISLGTFSVLNITPDCRATIFIVLKKKTLFSFS